MKNVKTESKSKEEIKALCDEAVNAAYNCLNILESLQRAEHFIFSIYDEYSSIDESGELEEAIKLMGKKDDDILDKAYSFLDESTNYFDKGSLCLDQAQEFIHKGLELVAKSISLLNVYALSKKKVNAKFFKDLDTTALIVVEKLEEIMKKLSTIIEKPGKEKAA